MARSILRMGRLVRADLRHHRGGFVGVAVSVFIATMLVTGLGVLIESGIRGGLAPERYTEADIVVGAPQQVEVPPGPDPDDSGDLPVPLVERAALPDVVTEAVAAVPGVARVVADVTVPLASDAGARIEGHPWESAQLGSSALSEGRGPAADDEVVVTPRSGAAVGDVVRLAHGGVTADYRVVGVLDGLEASRVPHVFLTAERVALLDPREGSAQALGVFLTEGASPQAVAESIGTALPDLAVQTGDGRGDVEFLDSGAARMTLIAIGSAFVGTAILVALFIVASTLSLSVQARRRDFALLRAVGAAPSQIRALITREVLVVAGSAALLGVAPGYLLSSGLQAAFVQGGVIPGDFALALGPLPAAGALLLVIGVAWAAAAIAGRRPARLDPIEAMRESSTGPRRLGLPRKITGVSLAVAGLGLSAVPAAVQGDAGAGAAGASALLLIIALGVLGPALIGLLMRTLAPMLRRSSTAGFLAASNGIANSRRMAGAIIPLALGIGLGIVQVGAPAIVAAEAATQARDGVIADLRVSDPSGLSADAVTAVTATPGVTSVTPIVLSAAVLEYRDLDGSPMKKSHTLQGVDAAAMTTTLDLRLHEGSFDALRGEDAVAVSTDMMQTLWVDVGDTVRGVFGDGVPLEATVVATYERGLGFGDLTMAAGAVQAHTTDGLADFALVSVDDGAAGAVRSSLEAAGLVLSDVAAQKAAGADEQAQQSWVGVVALIVILGYIAIAVVNTLVMATGERAREFALLQLVGSRRGQVRAMMRIEALLIVGIAAGLGALVAMPPLAGMSAGVSGSPIPALPIASILVIVGVMVALALVSLGAATAATMRSRPIDEIGSRE